MQFKIKLDKFNAFRIDSRINRLQHLGLLLFWIGIAMFCGIVSIFADKLTGAHKTAVAITAVATVIAVINLIILNVRRLHDFNLSWWWVLLIFIPGIGLLWEFLILTIPGSDRVNQYGPIPKEALRVYYVMMVSPLIVFFLTLFASLILDIDIFV